jgi:hypothetical protein
MLASRRSGAGRQTPVRNASGDGAAADYRQMPLVLRVRYIAVSSAAPGFYGVRQLG